MQVCLIPPKGLESYALHSRHHLALAMPELLRNSAYVNIYKRAVRGGDFVILDNGEAEGARVSGDELLAAAQILGATEIVIPDVIGQYKLTRERAINFLKAFELSLVPYQLMAVVQGTNYQQLQLCVRDFADMPEITTLGIPRHLLSRLNKPNVRVDLANWIHTELPGRFQIHALGVSPLYIQEVKWLAKYASHIRSIDSSLPFNAAIEQLSLTTLRGAVSRPGAYFSQSWGAANVRRNLIISNIETFKEWAGASESGADIRGGGTNGTKKAPVRQVRGVPTIQFGD